MVETIQGNHFLVTGGCGYIGAHLVEYLYERGVTLTVIDNLINPQSNRRVDRIRKMSRLLHEDLTNKGPIESLLTRGDRIDGIFHLASLTSIPESMVSPSRYLKNNLRATQTLLESQFLSNVPIIYSSSCDVYGNAYLNPSQNYKDYIIRIKESTPVQPLNPYAVSKRESEDRIVESGRGVCLRFFNAIGSTSLEFRDETLTGLSPALRSRQLTIYGMDYPTSDGTAIRDYIHILDVVDAHLKAYLYLVNRCGETERIFNLGSDGVSVLEMAKLYRANVSPNLQIDIRPRRNGDIASIWADSSLFRDKTEWNPTKTLLECVKDIY